MPGRNPYFTGRKEQLQQIHDAFVAGGSVAVTQAIRGLGGIGKTSLAVEFAYVYAGEYTKRLFCRADSEASLASGFLALAGELGLQLPEEKPEYARQLVLGWLANSPGWLLIVDNVDFSGTFTPEALRTWLPPDPKGHVLLTSRTNEGFGKLHVRRTFALEKMPIAEATPFLIERMEAVTLKKVSLADQRFAFELAQELDGLPLALEQAAAYIGNQGHSFERYLREFRERFEHIEKAGPESEDYPYTVATTWEMSFQAVEKESPVAAEILRYSAFLSPDAIPGEIFIDGASQLGGVLVEHFRLEGEPSEEWLKDRWEDALRPLVRYSLAMFERESLTHDVHRMVQAVIRNRATREESEARIGRLIAVLVQLIPDPKDFRTWSGFQRLVDSILAIDKISLFSQDDLQAIPFMLNRIGVYFEEIGRYVESEIVYRRVISIYELFKSENNFNIASGLNNLANLFRMIGRNVDAEPLFRRMISIHESALPEAHPDLAAGLTNLALVLMATRNYSEAEVLMLRSISILEMNFPQGHSDIARGLNNLASLFQRAKRFDEAEPLFRRAVLMGKSTLPNGHPYFAEYLNNLAMLLNETGRYAEAESLYHSALRILVDRLDWDHPKTQIGIRNYLVAKLADTGKIQNPQTEGIKYINEHPDEVLELLREVFASPDDSGGTSNEL